MVLELLAVAITVVSLAPIIALRSRETAATGPLSPFLGFTHSERAPILGRPIQLTDCLTGCLW